MSYSFIKKTAAIVLSLSMLMSTAGCNTNTKKENDDSATQTGDQVSGKTGNSGGKLFDKPTKLSIMIGSHPSWPYDPNWKMWQYVKEATNTELDITAVPNEEISTKVNLIMASRNQLPDLLHITNKGDTDKHALSGAFVSILDNLDKLPNFKKWMDTTQDSKEYVTQRTAGDGKVYFFPTYGLHTINNMRAWMYRKDIFDKHNLTPPKDTNEMYETAKKLKELYPDSYPLAFRTGLGQFSVIGPQWKPYFDSGVYYDFVSNKWSYGGIEDTMKEMIVFFKKMYDEKLVPPDYLTITTQSWQQLVSSSKGFMMPEYIVRVDFFNQPARKQEPDYTWAVMEPPKATTSTGSNMMVKTNYEFSGYLICNTGNKERMDNALKFADWMYNDAAIDLLSWGKEGETYKTENGERQFILDDKGTPARNLYGIGTYGLYQVVDPTSNEALYSKENVENARKAITYLAEKSNPRDWVAIGEKDADIVNQVTNNVKTYSEQEISKFLLGQRPLGEWDNYVKEVKKLGIDQLLEIYDRAYKKATQSK